MATCICRQRLGNMPPSQVAPFVGACCGSDSLLPICTSKAGGKDNVSTTSAMCTAQHALQWRLGHRRLQCLGDCVHVIGLYLSVRRRKHGVAVVKQTCRQIEGACRPSRLTALARTRSPFGGLLLPFGLGTKIFGCTEHAQDFTLGSGQQGNKENGCTRQTGLSHHTSVETCMSKVGATRTSHPKSPYRETRQQPTMPKIT